MSPSKVGERRRRMVSVDLDMIWAAGLSGGREGKRSHEGGGRLGALPPTGAGVGSGLVTVVWGGS